MGHKVEKNKAGIFMNTFYVYIFISIFSVFIVRDKMAFLFASFDVLQRE